MSLAKTALIAGLGLMALPAASAQTGAGVRTATYTSMTSACAAYASGALSSPCITGGIYVLCVARRTPACHQPWICFFLGAPRPPMR